MPEGPAPMIRSLENGGDVAAFILAETWRREVMLKVNGYLSISRDVSASINAK